MRALDNADLNEGDLVHVRLVPVQSLAKLCASTDLAGCELG